ncbi:hypothetical protein [Streptomyces sp. NPDC001828]|uniref:hypothetical protein n=1 Tax=Streptomyces sp. NPDC001828 TaxID=3364615 RepID=UPI0036A462A2
MGVEAGRASGSQQTVEGVVVLHVLVSEEQKPLHRRRRRGHVEQEIVVGCCHE